MTNRIRSRVPGRVFLGVFLLSAALSACGSGPQIRSNTDPAANWSGYGTFGFYQPLGTDKDNVRTILSNQLVASTTRELERRGLTRNDSAPDLLLNFVVSTRETVQAAPSGGIGIHHGSGRYGTWGGYSMSMSTAGLVQGVEGTLAIDVVDRQQNQLVWEAAATKRITEKMRRNQQQVVDAAVVEMFERFPIEP